MKKQADHHRNNSRRRAVKPHVCYIITSAVSTRLLRGQLRYLVGHGFDVTLITSPGEHLETFCREEAVSQWVVPMQRDIALLSDLKSLWMLWFALIKLRPNLVNASTPKAGLLGMLAAVLARSPRRVYVVRGLRLETLQGPRRWVLACTEWLASRCAHRVICVSHSLRDAFLRSHLAPEHKVVVLGDGSSNGVDADEFPPRGSHAANENRRQIRSDFGIPEDAPVIGFVGRINRDKGLPELLSTFSRLLEVQPDLHLLFVGDYESGGSSMESVRKTIESHPQIQVLGFQSNPAPYYAAMDVLVHPSLREGFPNAPLEAAAAGLPVVGFRVTGVVDAIEHGATGRLVDAGDQEGLTRVLLEYLRSPKLIENHGSAGRRRVQQSFSREIVWSNIVHLYQELLFPATTAPRNSIEQSPRAAA